jgi:nitroimidazol reductase NimA-like FMN-containing flavoprotein (pyridoxamine 5'-phosphate oxidase superfamily)
VPADVTAEIHGYSHPDATPTLWEVGREQVASADTFWISTVRPDGRPHVTPLIAVWHDEAIWFTTGPEERKARNLSHNAACILTTGRSELREGGLDVVLEGAAEQVTNDAALRLVADAFAAKYDTETWHFVVRTARSSITMRAAARWCSACGPCVALGSARARSLARRPGASPLSSWPMCGHKSRRRSAPATPDETRKLSPSLSPHRSTATQKTVISRAIGVSEVTSLGLV